MTCPWNNVGVRRLTFEAALTEWPDMKQKLCWQVYERDQNLAIAEANHRVSK